MKWHEDSTGHSGCRRLMNTLTGVVIALIIGLFVAMGVRIHTLQVSGKTKDAAIATLVKDQGHDRATIERMGEDARLAAEAKRGTDDVIKGLRDRLSAAVGQQQETEKLASAATSRARAAERAARIARDELTNEREQLYAADPSSDAWRSAVLPAGIALGLRIEWDKARAAGMPHDAGADDRGYAAPTARSDPVGTDRDPVAAALAGAYDWTVAIAVPEYTNLQLRDALSDALTGYTICALRLREIGRMQAEAIEVKQ